MTVARAAFAANWLLTSRWLRGGQRMEAAGRGLAGIGQPGFLTTFARLPPAIAEAVAEAASTVAGAHPEHYRYPPASIHLTVLGLADRPGVEDEIGAIVGHHPPFVVDVGGLNVSPNTVFAELYPRGSGLRALRGDLRGLQSGERGPISRGLRRRLAHANLIRFAAPVDPRLLAEVRLLRQARFGRFVVDEVELARTDKVLSDAGTRPLGSFRLGGAPSGAAQPG